MQNCELKLTLNEINVMLQALGNAPYVTVADLIAKIREQVTPQLHPPVEEDDK